MLAPDVVGQVRELGEQIVVKIDHQRRAMGLGRFGADLDGKTAHLVLLGMDRQGVGWTDPSPRARASAS